MQVPAVTPHLKLVCRIEGNAELPQPGTEWTKVLSNNAVSVYVVESLP
jgi:hypothetical protein